MAPSRVVVDLSGVGFIASLGRRLLISSARNAKAKSRVMVLFGATTMVHDPSSWKRWWAFLEPGALHPQNDGIAFDPTQAAEPPIPASLLDAPIGGRGLKLLRRTARSLSYERREGRNRLRVAVART